MGIDCKLKKLLITNWAPNSYKKGAPPCHKECKEGGVILNDISTSCRGVVGPNVGLGEEGDKNELDYKFSGYEFYRMILEPCLKVLTDHKSNISVYVFCLDQSAFVPPEKRKEQERRQGQLEKDDKHMPYPNECEVGAKGVREGDGDWQRFDIFRMMNSRKLRGKLWRYVIDSMREDFSMNYDVPEGATIIFDHELQGALVMSDEGCEYMPCHRHDLGEGEMMCLYWASVFQDRPCTIVTTDTDVLPITASFCSSVRQNRRYPLYWTFDRFQSHVNLTAAHETMRKDHGWTAFMFLTLCIVCGTDYVNKSWYLHYVQLDKIMEGIKTAQESDPGRFVQVAHLQDALEYVLVHIYRLHFATHLKKDNAKCKKEARKEGNKIKTVKLDTLDHVRNYAVEKDQKRLKVPSVVDMAHHYKLFRFNVCYWARDWCAIEPALHPKRPAIPSMPEDKTWRNSPPLSVDSVDMINRLHKLCLDDDHEDFRMFD